MLHVVSVCTSWCMLLDIVVCCCAKLETGQTFQPTDSQHFFFLFRDRRSVAQQSWISCWIRLHSSSNINGARHAHYAWFTKTYELYPTQTHCRSQHCWELLHPFADNCQHAGNNSQYCWRNDVGSCCVRLHAA